MTRTAMTDHTKAIEAAARAHCDHFGGPGWFDSGCSVDGRATMMVAMAGSLAAFLRTVGASPAMIYAGVDECSNDWRAGQCAECLPGIFKAMSATLADEVENG